MKNIVCLIVSVMVLLSAVSGYAQEVQRITYMQGEEGLYSVDFNNMWNLSMENGDITGTSDDGMVWFFLGDLEKMNNFSAAADDVRKTMTEHFTDIKETKAMEEFDLNGMPAMAFEGLAKEQGKDVVFYVVLFRLETDDMGVFIFVMDPAAETIHLESITEVVTSVDRI